MHIKNIHCIIEKLSECAKCEIEKGIEYIDTKEMGEVAEMIKELCEAEYYAKITKAMEKEEKEIEEDEKFFLKMLKEDYGMEDDEAQKYYRGQPRSRSTGRFMSRGDRRRSRRGYEPMMMHEYDIDDMEYMRDMDRGINRMYYSGESGSSDRGGSQGVNRISTGGQAGMGNRGYSDSGNYGQTGSGSSRSENARRGYEETKMMNDNSPEGKKRAMESLDHYMKELAEDMTGLVGKMDNSEKTLLKTKLQGLIQKIS